MRFKDLTEAQILAVAISSEEEDAHIYRDFAESLRKDFPASSELFIKMAEEEDNHRHRLIDLFRSKFGEHIPLITRQDVKGFLQRRRSWITQNLRPEKAREEAAIMEIEARHFYEAAATKASDAGIRQLLGDLAQEEISHEHKFEKINTEQIVSGELHIEHETARRLFILRFIQPGLAGLMDGSVSTLAPLFAAAFATSDTQDAFKVGLAASIGAGISMGFAEALSDDGKISGRGSPLIRGMVCCIMTAMGGFGHTIPFLINDFHTALTVAMIVVVLELGVIAWIRKHYMDTALLSAIFQVVVGGILVFLVGWLVGSG
jgi:rubrerythrin